MVKYFPIILYERHIRANILFISIEFTQVALAEMKGLWHEIDNNLHLILWNRDFSKSS